jgi:phosphate transport system permease protein
VTQTTPFTGRQRKRKTSRSVRLGEVVARTVITVGGLGTIASVLLIMVFLVSVVLPLFLPASLEPRAASALQATDGLLALRINEGRSVQAILRAGGRFEARSLDTGELLWERTLFESTPSAQFVEADGSSAVFGFADGSVRVVRCAFTSEFLLPEEGQRHSGLPVGAPVVEDGGVLVRAPSGALRRESLQVEVGDPIPIADQPIRLIDRSQGSSRGVICVATASGDLLLYDLTEKKNLLTGKTTQRAEKSDLPALPLDLGDPLAVLIAGAGDEVLVLWPTGEAMRIDARDRRAPQVAERLDLLPDPDTRVTAFCRMPGRTTTVIGDSAGGLAAWFTTRPEGTATVDGATLTRAHVLSTDGAALTALGTSTRSRLLAAGRADGSLELYHVTTGELLATERLPGGERVDALELAPREDGLYAAASSRLARFELNPGHPTASLHALFTPLWYEGYPEPEHIWQSSSGSDEFEPKMGLTPLVIGTLKATLYSMLFGAPIALLAAVYTSEILNRRYRTAVKSVIEIMAGLPSVVLGFLAALVIAPFVQSLLSSALALFLTMPLALLSGAHLWQALPRPWTLRMEGIPRLLAIAGMLTLGIWSATFVGPAIEKHFFAGDALLWLDGQVGTGKAGWFFLLLPLAVLATLLVLGAFVNPVFRARSANWSHSGCALASLAKFLLAALAAAGLALLVATLLQGAGLDPRRNFFGLVDTYVQRNALVVGFVMGFAVIPIIYTLAEDALSSVPQHLRLASFGAGATPWQTAMRVVIPTAMSGLFSALMIGLGRAVGETMIVLMATGNTAVMNLSIFNGFRTLSANIAVELPEAVQGSTHYRTLFFAALILFALTFVLNTAAELVRQRFRRRAVQL